MKARLCGDMGDCVYWLSYLKKIKCEKIYLDPSGGRLFPEVGEWKFNRTCAEFLLPLFNTQIPTELYINQDYDICPNEWHKEHVDLFFNEGKINLREFYAEKFGFGDLDLQESWISLNKKRKIEGRNIAINRTSRYISENTGFYKLKYRELSENGFYIGIEEEYEIFVKETKLNIPFVKTQNSLELAHVINGAELFVGNGSLCASIAIALGKDVFYELAYDCAHYFYDRDNIIYFI